MLKFVLVLFKSKDTIPLKIHFMGKKKRKELQNIRRSEEKFSLLRCKLKSRMNNAEE